MKKVLIVLVLGIILIFAFRALLHDGDDADITGQVVKDIEGDAADELSGKADALEELAYEKVALAQQKYDDLESLRDDLSDISLKRELQDQIDKLNQIIDDAQKQVDDSLFEDAIDSANGVINTADSLLERDYDKELADEPQETLDRRQELRLNYAQTVQKIEDLVQERSKSTDKDYYTDEINDLSDSLDNIKYELALLDAAAEYHEKQEELQQDKEKVLAKIASKKERIAQAEARVEKQYTDLNAIATSDAYLDADYGGVISLISEKEDTWDDIDDEYASIDKYNDEISELHVELREIEQKLNFISDMILLKESLADIQLQASELEGEIEDLQDEYDTSLRSNRKYLLDRIESMEDDLDDLLAKKSGLESYIDEFEQKVDI